MWKLSLLSVIVGFGLIFQSPAKAEEGSPDRASDRSPAAASNPASSSSGEQTKNIRISPLGLLIGYINVDVDFGITPEWSIGPTASYWGFDFDSADFTGSKIRVQSYTIGARANWQPGGIFKTGWFISPIFQYVTASAEGTSRSTGAKVTASGSVPVISALFGYHWFGQTLNLSLGAGFGFGASSSKIKATDGTTTTEVETSRNAGLALDFMIGYAF